MEKWLVIASVWLVVVSPAWGQDDSFGEYVTQLEALAITGVDELDRVSLARLNDIRRRHDQGAEMMVNRSPDVRAVGAQMIMAANNDLSRWIESVETRIERMADEAKLSARDCSAP